MTSPSKDTATVTFTRRELYYIENSMTCSTPHREDMSPEERSAYDKIAGAYTQLTQARKERK